MSPIAIDLLGRLLNKIPTKRLGVKSFADIKKHKFFETLDWDKLAEKQTPYDNGIFTDREIEVAKFNSMESLDDEDALMDSVKEKVDFYDED